MCAKHCGHDDCFSCPYPDCIADEEKLVTRTWYNTPERRAKRRADRKGQRTAWAAQGLCTTCGRKRHDRRFKQCLECRRKMARYGREWREKHGHTPRVLMDGATFCTRCGKLPPMDGKRVCAECMPRVMHALAQTPTHKGQNGGGFFNHPINIKRSDAT